MNSGQKTDGTTKPIAHTLRALLPAEKNYSRIEKEALGITFTISKFPRFIHGRHFTLQTDHKPLLTILGPKKVCLLTQPTDCIDGVQSCLIIISKRFTYHRINSAMRTVYQGNFQIQRTTGRHCYRLSSIWRRIKN